eukprot:CAMPEP_0172506418 /NCGR_PEP_ID=MMETSP1066-20121228/194963_1 /TAXON_ID=671091 /ORGANISM="Coscinodiscus wailesii, Strain CCMP2513" /LENGTH=199 /DNA_ID=CAMNT_0013283449 /DNA_START=28 /DNA_END=627 /DNA_ORIENTATION=+
MAGLQNIYRQISSRCEAAMHSLSDETKNETIHSSCSSLNHNANEALQNMETAKYPAHKVAIRITDDDAQFRKLKKELILSEMITDAGVLQVMNDLLKDRIEDIDRRAARSKEKTDTAVPKVAIKESAAAAAHKRWGMVKMITPLLRTFRQDDDRPEDATKGVGETMWKKKRPILIPSDSLSGRRQSTVLTTTKRGGSCA